MINFCHLRVKTEFSLLASTVRVDKLADALKEDKQAACCSMDDVNLSSGFSFSQTMSKNKIKPLTGMNVFIKMDTIKSNEPFTYLSFIAKNDNGYRNMLKMLYKANFKKEANSFNQQYLELNEVLEYHEDLVCLSGYNQGLINQMIKLGMQSEATKTLTKLKEVFQNDFYIEIQRHGMKNDKKYEDFLLKQALEIDIPVVATCDVRFLKEEDFISYDALCCIKNGAYLLDRDRDSVNDSFNLASQERMNEIFSDIPEALINTTKIAQKCSYILRTKEPMLPKIYDNEPQILEELATKGLQDRLNKISSDINYKDIEVDHKTYFDRMKYEINVINGMGFAGYFLIVNDFIVWSKNNDVPVGPGRGSGAGSIVAWALYITNVDPIKFGLLFERFLNPDRISMPDFDIDFCQESRHKVIEYVAKKYGENNVVSIMTFGKLQARAAIKDVGRVLQISYPRTDAICKMIPFNPIDPVTIEKAIKMDPILQKEIDQDSEIQNLITIASKLEGLKRHHSTHAAGVIIASNDISNMAPMQKDYVNYLNVLSYDMKDAEKNGFVKFDFLGLKTLTIIKNTINLVKERHGISIDIDKISYSDPKVFDLLKQGLVKGIFQLESAVPRNAIKEMEIDRLDDIVAITSLNRPGPMEFVGNYINRKLGKEKFDYYHDSLTEVLGETYGIAIYQEQVMQIAQKIANYKLSEADLLRRAMGKKDINEMNKQREIFIKKSLENNIDIKKAEEMFGIIEKFVGYGFNKSHAVSYSIISYQTAFLKAHYIKEFTVSMLNINIHNSDKVYEFVADAKKFNLSISTPDIMKNEKFFTIDNEDNIVFGLLALKGIGEDFITEFISIRDSNINKFKNLFDMLEEVSHLMNKKIIESFILSGALECYKFSRKMLFENVDLLLKFCTSCKNNKNVVGLFGVEKQVRPKLINYEEFDIKTKLQKEFETIGFHVSAHPLDEYKNDLAIMKNLVSSENLSDFIISKNKSEIDFFMAGVITKVIQRFKKNGRFAFVHVADTASMFETFIFKDEIITNNRELLDNGKLVAFRVSVKNADESNPDALRLVIGDIFDIDYFIQNYDNLCQKLNAKTPRNFKFKTKKNTISQPDEAIENNNHTLPQKTNQEILVNENKEKNEIKNEITTTNNLKIKVKNINTSQDILDLKKDIENTNEFDVNILKTKNFKILIKPNKDTKY